MLGYSIEFAFVASFAVQASVTLDGASCLFGRQNSEVLARWLFNVVTKYDVSIHAALVIAAKRAQRALELFVARFIDVGFFPIQFN